MFQFLMVQLKVSAGRALYEALTLFQFLMVQLKASKIK